MQQVVSQQTGRRISGGSLEHACEKIPAPRRDQVQRSHFHTAATTTLLTSEAAWDMLDEQRTVLTRTTNCVHDASSTALSGACRTNDVEEPPKIFCVRRAGKRDLGSPRYRDVCKREMRDLNVDLNK